MFQQKEEMIKKFGAIYSFELSGGPNSDIGIWFVDVKTNGVMMRGKQKGNNLNALKRRKITYEQGLRTLISF